MCSLDFGGSTFFFIFLTLNQLEEEKSLCLSDIECIDFNEQVRGNKSLLCLALNLLSCFHSQPCSIPGPLFSIQINLLLSTVGLMRTQLVDEPKYLQ